MRATGAPQEFLTLTIQESTSRGACNTLQHTLQHGLVPLIKESASRDACSILQHTTHCKKDSCHSQDSGEYPSRELNTTSQFHEPHTNSCFWREMIVRNPTPRGGFSCWVVSTSRTWRKRTLPEKQPQFLEKLGLFVRGSFAWSQSSSSMFLVWKPPNKEKPPGGRGVYDQSGSRGLSGKSHGTV